MADRSNILSLPYIQPNQAQKHVTHNEALRLLDILVQLAVEDDTQATPASSPLQGARYIVAQNGLEDWAGHDGELAVFDNGTWQFFEPKAGWQAYVAVRHAMVVHNGNDWQAPDTADFHDIAALGVGMTATVQSPFSAKLNSALWTAQYDADGGSGSIVHRINKEAAAQNAGFVFQTDFETRSLFGLFGNELFRLSMSPNGTDFKDGFVIDPATAIVEQPHLPRFKAATNFDNTGPADSWIKIAINEAEYNDQGTFDAVTNVFTAPADGSYMFGASLAYGGISGDDARMGGRLIRNGSAQINGSTGFENAVHVDNETVLTLQTLTYLNAGDTVELQGIMRGFAGNFIGASTTFWGMKV